MKIRLVLFTKTAGGCQNATFMVTVAFVYAHAFLQQPVDVRYDQRFLLFSLMCAPIAVMVFVAMA